MAGAVLHSTSSAINDQPVATWIERFQPIVTPNFTDR